MKRRVCCFLLGISLLCLPVQQAYAAPLGPEEKAEEQKEKPVPPHEKEEKEKPVPPHEKEEKEHPVPPHLQDHEHPKPHE